MVYAHGKKSASKTSRQTITRVLAVLIVSVIGVLAFAGTRHTVGVSAKLSPTVNEARSERSNPRISVRSEAAAVAMSPAPFAPVTVDRTDDAAAASACTAAANDCSLRGSVAFANLNPGTTINVPAGTYQLNIPGGFIEGFAGTNAIGDLDVTGNNTSIVGAGATATVIQQTQPNDRVLEINPFLLANFNFGISGVTLSGGKETTAVGGGGIVAGSINNTTSVTNCVISGNSATGIGTFGGGGIMVQGGSLTMTGTTLSSNSTATSGGGLSYTAGDPLIRIPSVGVLVVSGSTFSGNTANSVASGGGGADLFNFNSSTSSYSIDSSTFSNNNAANANGGAIMVESGPLTLTTTSLSGNTAANRAGAIYSSGDVVVTYSRLVGNSVPIAANGLTLFSVGTVATANDNWWGINTGPSVNDFRNTAGPITPTDFLKLRVSASPGDICTGGTSTLTADIKERSVGLPLTVELNGLPAFPAIFGNVVLGTLSGATPFVNGVATATFTAGATAGTGGADVTGDNQTVTASINISANDTTDPADQIVCEGQTATFTTTASGPGPITFVWKKGATVLNNGDLSGRVSIVSVSNNSTLSISNAQPGDADTYTVETTGSCSTTSQTASLTVGANTTATDPVDQTVCQGASASFSTTATGTNLHYAWTLDGSPFNGDNPSINLPTGTLSAGSHTIGLTVTGSCGTVTHSATLTVQENTVASDPADVTVCEGGTANFSTTASGSNLTYAWTLDGSPFNGNSPSISVPTGSLTGSHTVGLTVTGDCGIVTHSSTLTVNANTTATDPADQTVCEGAIAAFSTTATGTNNHYAWTLDGSPFNGDSASINVPTGSLSIGSHTIGLTVTGECGTVSHSATLNVKASTVASDPADVALCQGGTANFSTAASGSNLTYAWTLDGSPFNGNSSSISVPTGSLSVGSHTVGLTVTGDCGVVTQSATLNVQATTATTDPPDQSVCRGTAATFSTTASGTGPFHYAWTLDGLPFNGDSPSITVPTGSLSAGSHSVTVTTSGSCGTATQTATLNVTNPTPVITLSSTSATMWPPDHQYQSFTVSDFVSSATGGCDSNTNLTGSVVIQSVSSDEPEDNPSSADGSTIDDIVIAPDCKSVQLRRERDGSGNGRVYTITFKVSDSFGNTSTATVKVFVPINNNGSAVDDGAAAGYTVNSICP